MVYCNLPMVEEIIKQHIQDDNSVFVFPTQVTALMWAEKALFFSGCTAVALERFIAWDTFKSSAVRSVQQNKTSIPSSVRKLFALKIIERNISLAEENKPLFTSLIPQDYAFYGSSFSGWLSSLLPQLASWKEKTRSISDAEDTDLQTLMNEYTSFLDSHSLFEPTWEKPPFRDDGLHYYLFFPSILQDYGEYKEILSQAPNFTIIEVPFKDNYKASLTAFEYDNAREEIRKTAMYIRSLREDQNISYTSIAVHVPGIEDLFPYITREFSLRGIPYQLRAGKTLSSYPSGNLFSLIMQCGSEMFSFASLKQLLTNTVFPWKEETRRSIDIFLQYGITNNCLCPYETDGKFVDIWEKTLGTVQDRFVSAFYRLLKDSIMSFAEAKTFSALRQSYFAFKHAFFDPSLCTEETDLVLSRCITELMQLSSLEETFSDVIPLNPLQFFCRYLDSCEYLAQTQLRGVHIFPYKTAAGAPFDHSIVINAGQKQISVMYKPLDFLSRTKRDALHIEDSNVSDQFTVLYCLSHARFSCCTKTFSGWSLPHNVFTIAKDPCTYNDSFISEKTIFSSLLSGGGAHSVEYLYRIQKESFLKWFIPLPELRKPVKLDSISHNRVLTFLKDKKTQKMKIYATALREYFTCPLSFLYKNIFTLKPVSLEANLVDDVFLGTIYHAVLHEFFMNYTEQKLPQGSLVLPDDADEVLQESIGHILSSFPFSCFPDEAISDLTVQVVKAQSPSLYKKLSSFLSEFLLFFGSSKVVSSEKEYSIDCGDHILKGILDLVLETAQGIWIIDFKTSIMPQRNVCLSVNNSPLSDFQLPLYCKLFEYNEEKQVYGAAFCSIHQKKIMPLLGQTVNTLTSRTNPSQKKWRVSRVPDDSNGCPVNFTDTLKALDLSIELFKQNIGNNIFSLSEDIPYETCASCRHKTVCRTTFIVDGDKTAMRGTKVLSVSASGTGRPDVQEAVQ